MSTEPPTPQLVDLAALLEQPDLPRIAWSTASPDLNVNLIVLGEGETIPDHRNTEVDVLVVCISGAGELTVDGAAHALGRSSAMLVPRGAERALRALTDSFAYLTCHRRRAELWPATGTAPEQAGKHDR